MNGMFQYDGPIVTFFMKLGDMVILHVLWLLCCVPIVTIGPSTVAAHYVALKLVRDEGGPVPRMFFKSFKQNLRQGIPMGLIALGAGAFLCLDLYLCVFKMEGSNLFKLVMTAALVFLTILYLITMLYAWGLMARFDNTVRRTFVNAFLLAMSNWGATSAMLLLDIVIVAAAFLSVTFLPQAAVVFAVFGVPLLFVVNAFKLRPVLDRCQEAAEQPKKGEEI